MLWKFDFFLFLAEFLQGEETRGHLYQVGCSLHKCVQSPVFLLVFSTLIQESSPSSNNCFVFI